MSANGQQLDRDEVAHAIHRSHEQHAAHLAAIQRLLEASTTQLAVGGSHNDRLIENWPIPGLKRWSVERGRVFGSDGVATATGTANAILIAPAQPGRIGGYIANLSTTAANLILLYLAAPEAIIAGATPAVALTSAAGGFPVWDLSFGGGIWCGPVSAVAVAGAPSVAYAIA